MAQQMSSKVLQAYTFSTFVKIHRISYISRVTSYPELSWSWKVFWLLKIFECSRLNASNSKTKLWSNMPWQFNYFFFSKLNFASFVKAYKFFRCARSFLLLTIYNPELICIYNALINCIAVQILSVQIECTDIHLVYAFK